MKSIIIVDDHQIFRESVGELLKKMGYQILGTAANGKLLLDLLKKQRPDVVLMDISMPVMDGYETTRQALNQYPDLNILVLSSFGEEQYYYRMVELGVKGFVVKNAGINELNEAITEIINGRNWFSNELLQKIIISMRKKNSQNNGIKFSERELEVLNLICQGLSTQKIAENLNLSPETIRSHRSNLLSKTNCQNAPSLVMFAVKNKLIDF